MTLRARAILLALLLCAGWIATPSTLRAQGFERPPVFSAAGVLGARASGENHTVRNPVRSDGLLRIYVLNTPYGEIGVQGDQMLRMRLNELAVLDQLDKISGSEAFGKALVDAGLSPLKYTGQLIANPVGTIGDTFAGVGSFFDSIGAGMANAGKTQDDPLASAFGVSNQRRQLAARMGVDPYTSLPPLDEKLARLSEAAAAGGLSVTGALFFIPGAAGLVVSNLSTASRLGDIKIDELARSYTAAQILELNRRRLNAMGVEPGLAEALLANRNYTPIDMAVMVAALDGMGGVQDRDVFVSQAASANNRYIAYFMRRRAEMIAAEAARTGRIARFVSLGNHPYNLTRDGRILGLMPVDALAWTAPVADAFTRSAAAMKRYGRATGELRITGRATPLAKQRLKALGWTVVENVRF